MAHVHPKGLRLIRKINAAAASPNRTAYDILRLPDTFAPGILGSYTDQSLNRLGIVAELTDPDTVAPCACPGSAAAIVTVNAAWALLGPGPISKTVYDNALKARAKPLFPLPPFPAPSLYVPGPALAPTADEDISYSDKFIGVQDVNKTVTWKRVRPDGFVFSLYDYNTFWTALSMGLWDNWLFWAETKQRVDNFLLGVLANPAHPRNADYTNVNGPLNILTSMTSTVFPISAVTEHLWQVVADWFYSQGRFQDTYEYRFAKFEITTGFHIELLVIGTTKRPLRNSKTPKQGLQPHYPVTPRGDHNARQVFLKRESNDFYDFVRPMTKFAPLSNFRYDGHMVPDRISTHTAVSLAAEHRSNARRNPYVLCDAEGVPLAPLAILPGSTTILPAAVPPGFVLDQLSPPVAATPVQLNAIWNSTLWR